MAEKKKTHIDVLEEMADMLNAIEEDFADLVWFDEKPALMELATTLREFVHRLILKERAYKADGRTRSQYNKFDDLPF